MIDTYALSSFSQLKFQRTTVLVTELREDFRQDHHVTGIREAFVSIVAIWIENVRSVNFYENKHVVSIFTLWTDRDLEDISS